MLRALFILLALLAAVLALILQIPELYFAGALLLAGAVTVFIVSFFRRKQDKEKKPDPRSKPSDDDLSSLGILEIRPRAKAGAAPEEADNAQSAGVERQAEAPAARATRPPEEETAPEASSAFGVSPPTIKKKTVAEVNSEGRLKKDFLLPYLQAVQVALDATTVCLLRADAPQKYHIEGVVSKNSYARSYGQFVAKVPLLPAGKSRKAVHLMRIGEKGIPTNNLGYYLEPIAVRQVAVTALPLPSDPTVYLLLADTMEEGGLGTRRQRALLAQFAGLLGTVLDFKDTSAEEEDTEVEVSDVRPRRDIIAEEMRNARAEGHGLALALIYLNRAEVIAEQGQEAVLEAESQLDARLREAAEGTAAARVERFGELTYGVFFHGNVGEVEAWAVQAQHDMAAMAGSLEGGISIGVAMMQERHEGPDALRADATEALRAAYESGACTIIE